jgi:hypothetical protein
MKRIVRGCERGVNNETIRTLCIASEISAKLWWRKYFGCKQISFRIEQQKVTSAVCDCDHALPAMKSWRGN